jgi:integrase
MATDLSDSNKSKLKDLCSGLSDMNYLSITAVPFPLIIEAVNYLPYGNPIRVSLELLFLTGCRLSELPRMRFNGTDSFIKGQWLYWRVGKNQRGQWRKEWLSEAYLKELLYYRQTHRVRDDYLIGIGWTTLRRYFNRDVRPNLSLRWREMSLTPTRNKINNYKFMLKGIRKSFATLAFANEYLKWKDPTAALHFVSKKLCHSTIDITMHHYLNEFEALNMLEYQGMTPNEILSLADQKHICEYDNKLNNERINKENKQLRIQDF